MGVRAFSTKHVMVKQMLPGKNYWRQVPTAGRRGLGGKTSVTLDDLEGRGGRGGQGRPAGRKRRDWWPSSNGGSGGTVFGERPGGDPQGLGKLPVPARSWMSGLIVGQMGLRGRSFRFVSPWIGLGLAGSSRPWARATAPPTDSVRSPHDPPVWSSPLLPRESAPGTGRRSHPWFCRVRGPSGIPGWLARGGLGPPGLLAPGGSAAEVVEPRGGGR